MINRDNIIFSVPVEYRIKRLEPVDDINGYGVILEHKVSHAYVGLMVNDDENKAFNIVFGTAPENDKGIPHIIEHTVLCGSEKYPVKDPFMELSKSSMNTFLNAITFPDKTMYPVSSCNDADFVNLMNVYADAVFNPRIGDTRGIFHQEGIRFEENEDKELTANGVVYSEMKGAESSADSLIYDMMMNNVLKGTCYQYDSGGRPSDIVKLTYDEYIDYYKTHYTPSNAYIYLYGNFDISERLSFLDREYLSGRPSEGRVKLETGDFKRQNGRLELTYSQMESEEENDKTAYLAYASCVGECNDLVRMTAFDLICAIATESDSAEMKAELQKNGIGEEIFGGMITHVKYPVFTVVAKNAPADRYDDFNRIVRSMLEKYASEGISRSKLMSTIERLEFKFKENDSGAISKGLPYSVALSTSWLYSDEPTFDTLRLTETLSELRKLADTDYYKKLAAEILAGESQLRLIIRPDTSYADKQEKELRDYLDGVSESMTPSDRKYWEEGIKEFRTYQDTEDTKEALQTIPHLSLSDMKKLPLPFSCSEDEIDGVKLIYHDVGPGNGVIYTTFAFDVTDMTLEEVDQIDLMTDLFSRVGTKRHSYAELDDMVKMMTGSMTFSHSTVRGFNSNGKYRLVLPVSLKYLPEKSAEAMELVRELITESDFSDLSRIRDILAEIVSEKQRDIITAGNEYALNRSSSYFDQVAKIGDMIDGIGSYQSQKKLLSSFDDLGKSTAEFLDRMRRKYYSSGRLTIHFSCDKDDIVKVRNDLRTVISALPEGTCGKDMTVPVVKLNEGFRTSSNVQYVAMSGTFTYDDPDRYSSLYAVKAVLNNMYLYPEIRMKGGAYGHSCDFSTMIMIGNFSTYRDPNIERSIEVFRGAGKFLRELELTDSELEKYLIGVFGRIDRPLTQVQKVTRSTDMYVRGISYEDACEIRQKIFDTTVPGIRNFADCVDEIISQNNICVVGSDQAISDTENIFLNKVVL